LNLFAERFTRLTWFNYEIPAGWLQSLNPAFIIILSPVMAGLWIQLARRQRNPSIPAKFAWGLILVGAGFLVMAVAAVLIRSSQKVLPTWLIATYFIHTVGELCLSPVGLNAVSKLSPKRYLGQLMGLWFVATALGNLLAGLFAGQLVEDVASMPARFLDFVLFSAGAGLILLATVPLLRRWVGKLE
jgi:POT family proton-dependent oligopeptide transporter